MSKFHTVRVEETEGTGAGYGHPAFKHATGIGTAMCKKLSSAIRIAEEMAARNLVASWDAQGIAPYQIPVLSIITVDGKRRSR